MRAGNLYAWRRPKYIRVVVTFTPVHPFPHHTRLTHRPRVHGSTFSTHLLDTSLQFRRCHVFYPINPITATDSDPAPSAPALQVVSDSPPPDPPPPPPSAPVPSRPPPPVRARVPRDT